MATNSTCLGLWRVMPANTSRLCAYTRCLRRREIGRRYCPRHAAQYDAEAERSPTMVVCLWCHL